MMHKVFFSYIFLAIFFSITARSYSYKVNIKLPEFKSEKAKKHIDESIAKIKEYIINDIFIVKNNNPLAEQDLESSLNLYKKIHKKLTTQFSIEIHYQVNSKIKEQSFTIDESEDNGVCAYFLTTYTPDIKLVNTTEAYKTINYKLESFFNSAKEQVNPNIYATAQYFIVPIEKIPSDFNLRFIRIHCFKDS